MLCVAYMCRLRDIQSDKEAIMAGHDTVFVDIQVRPSADNPEETCPVCLFYSADGAPSLGGAKRYRFLTLDARILSYCLPQDESKVFMQIHVDNDEGNVRHVVGGAKTNVGGCLSCWWRLIVQPT